MPRLARNILANFGGQAATTLVAFIAVPLYLKFLGPDGYGLVSFILVLQAMTGLLDFGLSATANREVSRYIAQDRNANERRVLARTLETFYAATAIAIFAALAAATPWLSTRWFESSQLSPETIRTCLLIAAASIALRWPTAAYQGILRGAEQQVTLNVVTSSVALLRGVGSVLVLLLVARSVVVFYWWQLAFAFVELAICAIAVQRHGMGFTGSGGSFDPRLLRGLWRFSLNVGGMSMFALVLKQIDKLIVSYLLPISHLGYYNAASLASNGLSKVGQPIQTAVFPRLTQLHERGEQEAVARTFHHAVQLTALLTAPLACALIFFSGDVLRIWTRDAALASSASGALSVLAGAMLLNGMMSVPFSLMLASGMTRLPLAMNAAGAVLLTPITWILTQRHGLLGASVGWLLFNLTYFLIVPPVMLRRLLPGHYSTWLTRDTLPFMAAGLATFGAASWLVTDASVAAKVGAAGTALIAYGLVVLAATPELRSAILDGRNQPVRARLRALLAGEWNR